MGPPSSPINHVMESLDETSVIYLLVAMRNHRIHEPQTCQSMEFAKCWYPSLSVQKQENDAWLAPPFGNGRKSPVFMRNGEFPGPPVRWQRNPPP